MRDRIIPAVALVFAALILGGCYDTPPVVQIHEPGEYKGPPDPLVKKLGSTQQDEIFANRFKMVQTDR